MEHKILKLLNSCLEGIYEHKLCYYFGKVYGNFPELETLITNGFVNRFNKQDGFTIQGVQITGTGRTELARLDAIPPAPRVPTAEELRRIELVKKLQDDTITAVEVRELLRMVIVR